ncbi:hypothetical protein ABZP36_005437 [Zizania latifolia]
MYTARKKIQKEKGLEPSEFEDFVAQAFFDLENGSQELKSELKDLYINNAVQMDVAGNRKAVVIHVPYRLRKAFKKIHVRLVRELEKKFSGKDVVIVATRRIVRPPKKGSAVQRPRTRTLTAVHDGILEDVVYPAEIVGKRVRYRLDGAKVIKIFLDPKERNNTEYKLETFSAVYRRLCGKDVAFDVGWPPGLHEQCTPTTLLSQATVSSSASRHSSTSEGRRTPRVSPIQASLVAVVVWLLTALCDNSPMALVAAIVLLAVVTLGFLVNLLKMGVLLHPASCLSVAAFAGQRW